MEKIYGVQNEIVQPTKWRWGNLSETAMFYFGEATFYQLFYLDFWRELTECEGN